MDDYHIYITTIQASAIKTLVEVLKDVLSDVNVIFSPMGIKITSMDPTHVSLVQLDLHADKFEQYHCPERQVLGISMSSLYKLIKSISNSDNISFLLKKSNTSQLIIWIDNSDKNSKTEFHLKLLDLNEESLSIPTVDFDFAMSLPSNDFQKLCRDMQNLSEQIKLIVDHECIRISCEGDFASQETMIGETTHGLIYHQRSEKRYENIFSLKYINLFTKSTNLSNNIDISIKDNYPLVLRYSVANLGTVKFCLAPTIKE